MKRKMPKIEPTSFIYLRAFQRFQANSRDQENAEVVHASRDYAPENAVRQLRNGSWQTIDQIPVVLRRRLEEIAGEIRKGIEEACRGNAG